MQLSTGLLGVFLQRSLTVANFRAPSGTRNVNISISAPILQERRETHLQARPVSERR